MSNAKSYLWHLLMFYVLKSIFWSIEAQAYPSSDPRIKQRASTAVPSSASTEIVKGKENFIIVNNGNMNSESDQSEVIEAVERKLMQELQKMAKSNRKGSTEAANAIKEIESCRSGGMSFSDALHRGLRKMFPGLMEEQDMNDEEETMVAVIFFRNMKTYMQEVKILDLLQKLTGANENVGESTGSSNTSSYIKNESITADTQSLQNSETYKKASRKILTTDRDKFLYKKTGGTDSSMSTNNKSNLPTTSQFSESTSQLQQPTTVSQNMVGKIQRNLPQFDSQKEAQISKEKSAKIVKGNSQPNGVSRSSKSSSYSIQESGHGQGATNDSGLLMKEIIQNGDYEKKIENKFPAPVKDEKVTTPDQSSQSMSKVNKQRKLIENSITSGSVNESKAMEKSLSSAEGVAKKSEKNEFHISRDNSDDSTKQHINSPEFEEEEWEITEEDLQDINSASNRIIIDKAPINNVPKVAHNTQPSSNRPQNTQLNNGDGNVSIKIKQSLRIGDKKLNPEGVKKLETAMKVTESSLLGDNSTSKLITGVGAPSDNMRKMNQRTSSPKLELQNPQIRNNKHVFEELKQSLQQGKGILDLSGKNWMPSDESQKIQKSEGGLQGVNLSSEETGNEALLDNMPNIARIIINPLKLRRKIPQIKNGREKVTKQIQQSPQQNQGNKKSKENTMMSEFSVNPVDEISQPGKGKGRSVNLLGGECLDQQELQKIKEINKGEEVSNNIGIPLDIFNLQDDNSKKVVTQLTRRQTLKSQNPNLEASSVVIKDQESFRKVAQNKNRRNGESREYEVSEEYTESGLDEKGDTLKESRNNGEPSQDVGGYETHIRNIVSPQSVSRDFSVVGEDKEESKIPPNGISAQKKVTNLMNRQHSEKSSATHSPQTTNIPSEKTTSVLRSSKLKASESMININSSEKKERPRDSEPSDSNFKLDSLIESTIIKTGGTSTELKPSRMSTTTSPMKTKNRPNSTSTGILRLSESHSTEYWKKAFENQENEEWSEEPCLPASKDQSEIASSQASPNTVMSNVSRTNDANTEYQPLEIKVNKLGSESQTNQKSHMSVSRKLSDRTVDSETLSDDSYFGEFEKVDSSQRPASKGYNSSVKQKSVIRKSTIKPRLDESSKVQEGFGGYTNFRELNALRKSTTQSGSQPWQRRVIKVVEKEQAPGRIIRTVSKSGSWSSSSSSMGYKRLASNQKTPRKSETKTEDQNYKVEEFPIMSIIDTWGISSPYEMSDDSEISELLGLHSEKPYMDNLDE